MHMTLLWHEGGGISHGLVMGVVFFGLMGKFNGKLIWIGEGVTEIFEYLGFDLLDFVIFFWLFRRAGIGDIFGVGVISFRLIHLLTI